ncbi:MAG: hypothetical protein RLO48_05205, partial [Bauldia litoralis]
ALTNFTIRVVIVRDSCLSVHSPSAGSSPSTYRMEVYSPLPGSTWSTRLSGICPLKQKPYNTEL